MIRTGNLNTKVGSNKNLFGHVMGKHGLDERKNNIDSFIDFCNAPSSVVHRSKTGPTKMSFEFQLRYQIVISSRFMSCLLDVRNKTSTRRCQKGRKGTERLPLISILTFPEIYLSSNNWKMFLLFSSPQNLYEYCSFT